MFVDVLIIALCLSALYRGRKIGFLRQLLSTAGFFAGLLLGAWLAPHLLHLAQSTQVRTVLTAFITIGTALLLSTAGEYAGLRIKHGVLPKRLHGFDNGLGSLLSVISLLVSAWLIAAIVSGSSFATLKTEVRDSRIIAQLNRLLPPAPEVIAKLGHLIDPNGFPDVFVGSEPAPKSDVDLPALGDLATAVNADKNSVVRIKGEGCGGIVSGSGFVVRSNLVATNAHVVAGIGHPFVQDSRGTHVAKVVWFDPDLDFAILRVSGLAGGSLEFAPGIAAENTPAAVLGYPGGGNFDAKPAVVLDEIRARGRDIYGENRTVREVYELRADIIPGNSGGPIVGKDGRVIGIVFAESTSYNHVGYALTNSRLSAAINQAAAANQTVSTSRCAE